LPELPQTSSDWPQAIATVLECRYDMRAGRALIGIPSGKHFRIRYNYFANGDTHEAELFSATAIPQNTLFPIRYNPDLPTDHTHDHAATTPNPRIAMLTIGIIGSVILSLAWLFVLRGCS
jgi:hypothetical protein